MPIIKPKGNFYNHTNYVFHATYASYFRNIQQHGLLPGNHSPHSTWNLDHTKHQDAVFFTLDDWQAFSYAESSPYFEEHDDDPIIILAIPYSELNQELMDKDTNDLSAFNIAYKGTVPTSSIFVLSQSENLHKMEDLPVEKLADFHWH